jgi:hypothetical protein
MTRDEILDAIAEQRKARGTATGTEILFIRGHRIWWLHHYNYGVAEVERSEYGVN